MLIKDVSTNKIYTLTRHITQGKTCQGSMCLLGVPQVDSLQATTRVTKPSTVVAHREHQPISCPGSTFEGGTGESRRR